MKFCEGASDWLCESARIEVFDDRSTTEIKTGAMFLLLGASGVVILVIAGILLYR